MSPNRGLPSPTFIVLKEWCGESEEQSGSTGSEQHAFEVQCVSGCPRGNISSHPPTPNSWLKVVFV